MSSVDPIQPSQIRDWAELMGAELTREEIRLILEVDVAYRSALAKEQDRNRPKDKT